MPDLRASVAYLLRLRIPWTAEDLATLAAVPLPRARAYVAQLATATPSKFLLDEHGERMLHADGTPKREPLLQNPDGTLVAPGAVRTDKSGRFIPGPYARRFIALEPTTRPGGNSAEYRRQREVRARLEQSAWQAARAGELLTSDSPTNAEVDPGMASNVSSDAPYRIDDVPLTLTQAAKQLQMHTETVRLWIHAGKIAAWRVGPKEIRIPQSEVTRIRTPIRKPIAVGRRRG